MILVDGISFGHTGEMLYDKASFSVPKNKKAGLVGLNGTGKSTLFSLLMREEWPDEGSIRVEGRVMLVQQEISSDPIQSQSPTVREYLNRAKQMSDARIEELMRNMELGHLSLEARPSDLSGGQKTKLAILYAVLSEPDVLLLDEPTNFLDEAGKKWVMHWLSQYKKTLLVVSHDLKLLDKHIDKVVYINKQTKKFEEYTGTYSKFKQLKSERDRHLVRYIHNQEQKVKRMKESVLKLRRSNVEKVIRQRVQLERRIQKIEDSLPELPKEVVNIKLNLPNLSRIGEIPLRVSNVSKSYDDSVVLKDVSFSIRRGERFALIGHNGAGKSTLIKMIMGRLKVTSGKIDVDDSAKVGYYSQEFESFDLELSLYETIKQRLYLGEGHVRGFLAAFMFGPERIRQQVKSLSGGEKTRLAIAMLMLEDFNFLVLDEPTTYLDVLSQRIILEALKKYQGTMLVVSHTPEFLQELKPDKALLLPEEKVVYWSDNLLSRTAEM